MPVRYRLLLDYFVKDVLASLSCHPSVHDDLCTGLVPAMLHSPHLLSASLALSAAGFVSRGFTEVDGVDVLRVTEHLQSSGLPLLRAALARGEVDETLLATCIIWCLADVYAARQGGTSWRVHLQGIKAILHNEQIYKFVTNPENVQSSMRHLYLLYLSLQTLPHIPSLVVSEHSSILNGTNPHQSGTTLTRDSRIDGFLGYSEEVLDVLQQINQIADTGYEGGPNSHPEADILLGKVKGMISRDAKAPPDISISSKLSPESSRDFSLCHRAFQQATLIHVYRRLYNMPSGSELIRSAVQAINDLVSSMTQGQPCNTWVAMSMPLFTIGCETFSDDQKNFVLDKIHKLEVCLGSLHVRTIRQALMDIWKLRKEWDDVDGRICASQLLSKSRRARCTLGEAKLTDLTLFRGSTIQYCTVLILLWFLFHSGGWDRLWRCFFHPWTCHIRTYL
jgi:hypothetical protein